MSISECIFTYRGDYVSLAESPPPAITFDIIDIAHALSQICRFGGHTRQYYSVAQHSVLVSHLVPAEYRLQALMHDAAEAYYGDVVQPIKGQDWMRPYRERENEMLLCLFAAFGVKPTAASTAAVRSADLQMLATERRDLMAPDGTPWPSLAGVLPRQASITPVMPAAAETMFLKRFKELTGAL